MTKRANNKPTRYTAALPTPARHNSSDSDSDVEDRTHSRTSTSSVEEEQVKEHVANGNGVRHTSQNGEKDAEYSATFLTRITSIPVLHDGFTSLHSYAKDNKYGRYALDTAGSAVETVNKYTEGYQTRLQPVLQPHLNTVDKFATKSLDIIESRIPIITKPTAEIVDQVKKPYAYVEESSKNAYTQIQSTIDTRVTAPVKSVTSSIVSTATSTRDQVTNAAVSTRNQITAAATSTANNITTTATTTANTIATSVNTRATPLVDGLEHIVNRILPADAETKSGETTTQNNQAVRVVDIGRSVSLRVTRRVSVAVSPVTQQAKDLRAAAEKNAVVVKSKDQIHALNVRLSALIDSLRIHSKELQENVQKVPREASTQVQTRVSELSDKVLAEVDTLSVYLKAHSPTLPVYVQSRIQPLVDFVNDRYVSVKGEIVKKDVSAIQKARNILHLTTEETLPILQSAAKDIRESLLTYQVKAQEAVHGGLVKVQDVKSSVNLAAARTYHSVRVILVGSN